jgi:hypothetical protein
MNGHDFYSFAPAGAGVQQPGWQQAVFGWLARTKAPMNLLFTWGAIASTSTPASVRNCRASSTAVNARRLDRCILESSARQLCDVLAFFERAGDTANPEQHAFADSFRNAAAHDHIGDRESSAGL